MEYKIENGELKLPVSEFNKINHSWAELEKREEIWQKVFQKEWDKVNEAIENNMFITCIKENDFGKRNYLLSDSAEEALKPVLDKSLKDQEYNINKMFKDMTIREFIKFKKKRLYK